MKRIAWRFRARCENSKLSLVRFGLGLSENSRFFFGFEISVARTGEYL